MTLSLGASFSASYSQWVAEWALIPGFAWFKSLWWPPLLENCGHSCSFNGVLNVPSGLPRWCSGKESACNTGEAADMGSIPDWGGSPRAGNGNPLQYSCLENSIELGGLQSMGLQRVGCDWATEQQPLHLAGIMLVNLPPMGGYFGSFHYSLLQRTGISASLQDHVTISVGCILRSGTAGPKGW